MKILKLYAYISCFNGVISETMKLTYHSPSSINEATTNDSTWTATMTVNSINTIRFNFSFYASFGKSSRETQKKINKEIS